MDQTNQPSPYFVRRTLTPQNEAIEINNFTVVDDQVHPLREYWVTIKRHRWLILVTALAILICTVLYLFTRVPLYTAEATLLIERRAPQILKVQDARGESAEFNDYNNEFFKTQYEILKSPALAERVVREEGLQNLPLFGGGKPAEATKEGLVSGIWKELKKSAQGIMPAKQKPTTPDTQNQIPLSTRLAGAYLSRLEIRPVTGTSLVKVKFTTPDAAISARLANAHANSYVRYGVDLRSQTNEEAADFLKQRLTELKERVEQSETALNSYRKDKGIITVDEKADVVIDRWLELNRNLTKAEAERIGMEAQMRSIRGRSYDEIPTVRENPVISTLKNDLAKSEAEYASLSKEFKSSYPILDNLKIRIDETRRRLQAEIQSEVKKIEVTYTAAKNNETALRATTDDQKKTTLNLKDSAVQYVMLAREVETNKQLYDGVLQRLKEIGVAAEIRNSNIYLMGKATPPGGPSYPDRNGILLRGLFLGLLVGVGLAFLLDQLDNTIKSPEEAQRFIQLPNLGVVPDFALLTGSRTGYMSKLLASAKAELPSAIKDEDRPSMLDHHPFSLVAEAYRSLRSSLLLSQAGGPPHTMLMTSATRGEGKTTTLVNTAIVFSQLGIRVLVIDGDLRRPRCHMLLKMENTAGLADLLAGQIDMEEAIRPTSAENLFFISAGAVPPNPAELLGSKKMHELLQQFREQFEFIFIDSSPVMAVSDAVFLSTMVEGTLLVVNRRTPKPLVRKTRQRLSTPHTKILGVLLNRVDIRAGEYGSYYRHYYEYYPHDHEVNNGTHGHFDGNGAAPERNGNGALSHGSNGHSAAAPEPTVREKPGNGLAAKSLNGLGGKLIEMIGLMALREDQTVAPGASPDALAESRRDEPTKQVSGEIAQHKLDEAILRDAKIETENGAHQAEGPVAAVQAPCSVLQAPCSLSAPVERSKEIATPATTKFPDKGLSEEFLAAVGDKLIAAMGPMAPIVLREHVRALGESFDSFPADKLVQLTKRVSQEILHDYQRARFAHEIAEEIQKLGARTSGGVSYELFTIDDEPPKPAAKKEPPDTSQFLKIMSAKLAEAIGPIAPLVLRERIAALGESAETFKEPKIGELIIQLSIEISNDSARRQFQKEMAREIQNLKELGAGSWEPGVASEEAKSKWRGWGRKGKG
jgi:succinoglycan biosynthesis transport protein ExoP